MNRYKVNGDFLTLYWYEESDNMDSMLEKVSHCCYNRNAGRSTKPEILHPYYDEYTVVNTDRYRSRLLRVMFYV